MPIYMVKVTSDRDVTYTLGPYGDIERAKFDAQEEAWDWNAVNTYRLRWVDGDDGSLVASDRGLTFRIKPLEKGA